MPFWSAHFIRWCLCGDPCHMPPVPTYHRPKQCSLAGVGVVGFQSGDQSFRPSVFRQRAGCHVLSLAHPSQGAYWCIPAPLPISLSAIVLSSLTRGSFVCFWRRHPLCVYMFPENNSLAFVEQVPINSQSRPRMIQQLLVMCEDLQLRMRAVAAGVLGRS